MGWLFIAARRPCAALLGAIPQPLIAASAPLGTSLAGSRESAVGSPFKATVAAGGCSLFIGVLLIVTSVVWWRVASGPRRACRATWWCFWSVAARGARRGLRPERMPMARKDRLRCCSRISHAGHRTIARTAATLYLPPSAVVLDVRRRPVRPSLMQFVALCGRPNLYGAFNSLRPAAALLLWATRVRPAADTNVELAALTAHFDTDGGSRK